MRIFSFLLLSVSVLTAYADNFVIKGKAPSTMNGKKLYLVDQNKLQKADSCIVSEGTFEFKGTTDDQLLFELKNIDESVRRKIYIFVQPSSDVNIDLTVNPWSISDKGGMNDIMAAIDNEVAAKGDALNKRIQEMLAEGKNSDQLAEILKPDVQKVYDIYRKGIEDNKDNMVGAYITAMVAIQFYPSLAELDSVASEVKYSYNIAHFRKLHEEYKKKSSSSDGAMFIDFEGKSIDGGVSKLSDYVGKGTYVLVDFWASWCGPCKREIPNLLELQQKFGGDKFTVLGVNVWDTEDKFKAALVSEGINYPQIFIPRDNKDNATELYGIKGIPQIILFAPDGTIVKRDLRGAEMKALVEEKMK